MSKQTHTNPLSKREVEALRGNPYVASATTQTVRFTEEFKKLAYEGKQQGISIAETMRKCGIDPEVLGSSRIEGFSYTLNRKARQEGGFLDGRSGNYRRPAKTGEETVEQRLKELENPKAEFAIRILSKYFQLLSGLCTENPDFYQACVPKT